MINILVNGITLPLPPDLQITREVETTIFNRETSVSDFTYPLEIPLTDEVKKAFDMPHVISSTNYQKEHDADLIIDGMFISRVTIRILRVSPRNQTLSISILGDYGGFAKAFGSKMVNELSLGGLRSFTTSAEYEFTNWNDDEYINIFYNYTNFNAHMFDIAMGTLVDDFVFYSAADTNQNIATLHDPGGRSILNYWDPTFNYFPDPVRLNYEAALRGEPDRYFWVPFFRLAFVLQACFEESGFAVVGQILNDADFNKITLWNTYSINQCRMTQEVNSNILDVHIYHDSNTIDPRNHVPRMPIADFITEIGKLFNLQYVFDWTHRIVTIRQISVPTISTPNVIDLSNYAAPKPDINYEEENFSRGYEFSFANPPGDVRNNIEQEYNIIASVDYRGLLTGLGQDGDVALLTSKNAYYRKQAGQWVFFAHNLGSFKTSNEEDLQAISSEFSPVIMEEHGPSVAEAWQRFLFPTSSVGIEGKDLLCIVKPDFEAMGQAGDDYMNVFSIASFSLEEPAKHLCNWHGIQVNEIPRPTASPWTGLAAPYGSSTIYDARGYTGHPGAAGSLTPMNTMRGFNLCWNNPNGRGFYTDCFWDKFVAGLADAPQGEYEILLHAHIYGKLNLNEVLIRIDGLLFFCRKANINMPFPDISTFTLVRL